VINRPEVLTFLAAHHWVASGEQLRELRVTKSALEHARRRGEVLSPVPGVVTVPGVQLTLEGRSLLAQLSAGAEAFVSGPTAGALYGLRSMPTSVVEVTVKRRHVVLPPNSRLRYTHWLDEERDVIQREDGIRLASPLRMLFGLAGQFNQHRFERAAEDLWHKGLATPEQAWEYLEEIRRSGRAGVKRMSDWLETASLRGRPAQSGLELDLLAVVERAGLPEPERQHPLRLPSGETIHLDIAWPAIRLAVEPGHSWWHGGDLGQRRDQARDRACSAVGWLVLRYDERAAHRAAATAAELQAVYRARSQAPEAR
jgi:hypothetical protein